MKKRHKFLTTLLIVLLCVTMVTCLIACDNTTENENEEVKDTSEYITNGKFEVTTSDTYPKVPSAWTGSAGSTSSGNETDVDKDALSAGVINTEDEVYNKNKKHWDRLDNPRATGVDPNILMIYNKKPNSYKYTSNSFSLDSEKIFRIDFSVKTVNIPADSYGAYARIGGDAFVDFQNINTNSEWIKYSVMVKTSPISSNSLTVTFSNGIDGKNDGKLSEGYAFFDDVIVTEVVDTDKTAEEQYAEFEKNLTNTQKVFDMTLGDSSFNNISGDSNPFSARKWSGVSSVGSDGETAPTGSDYIERGIIDTNSKGIPSVAEGIKPFGKDSKFLMINNKQATAYGYRSDNKIRIPAGGENNDYYKLTVRVLTKDIEGKGAYIKLKSTTDKEEQIFILDNIKTDGKWSDVSIYIKPDAKRNKDIYIQLGLGTGGKNDTNDLVKGVAFFDEIALEKIDQGAYDGADADSKTSLESTISDNLLKDDDIYNKDNYVDGHYYKNDGITARGDLTISDKTITINNSNPTVTKYKYNLPFEIAPNNHYRLSIKVKTDILDKDKGVDIILYKKEKASVENGGKDTELTKITGFNSLNVEKNKLADGSTEFVFLIQGGIKETANLYFEVVLGTGTNLTPDSLVKGLVSLSNIELNKINYADYNTESGEYVKTHSLRSDDTTISNADFNITDIAATKTAINDLAGDNEENKFDEEDYLSGNSKGVFGLPQGWTTSSKDALDKIYAGIFNVNNEKQKELLGLTNQDPLKGMPEHIKAGNENVLAISTKANEQIDSWGFTSPSLSFSKGKYYELSIWAYMVKGSNATINLKSSSKSVIESFDLTANETGWKEYKIYVNAGFDDFTAYLELKLGDNVEDTTSNGTVLFDLPSLIEIDKEIFDAAEDSMDDNANPYSKAITFTTTTFDNTTTSEDGESLDTPTNWTGEHKDADAPSDKFESVAGVYNRLHGNRNLFGGENGKDKAPISAKDLENILDTAPSLKILDNGEDQERVEGKNNDNILVINNNVASEYTYTTTLAENSLKENKYYEVSLYVLTYDVPKDKTAKISLQLHNSTFEFSKNDARGINVNTDGKWQRYSFFIHPEEDVDIDTIKLSVSLGSKYEDNYVSGYLFVDNIAINEITEERFDKKVPENKFPNKENSDESKFEFDKAYSSNNHRIVFTKDDMKKEEVPEEEKPTDPLLWLYITSGVIGGILVIVVIIFLLKKFHVFDKLSSKKSNFQEKGSESYNRNKVNENKTNASTRDINKKHQD